jgi:cobalt/nickel transport system permease protein
VSHLHIPDGVLPAALWIPCLLVALLVIVLGARPAHRGTPRQVAFRGTLGALVLAVMSFHIPLGPVEYHLSLLGPVGVLLGPVPAFQVLFVVSAMLAMVGHGGLTVIGVNALVLGAGAALARPVFASLTRSRGPGFAMAAAAAASQAVAGALWVLVVSFAVRSHPGALEERGHLERLQIAAGVAAFLWVFGLVTETLVALGIGRFLARVKPELLPGGQMPPAAPAAGPAAAATR